MRRSIFVSSGQRVRWPARYRGDSGRTKKSSTPRTSGTTPPAMNSGCHPNFGMICPAIAAATTPPSGMQTIVSVTANGRCRRGTYSEASAAAFGMAPPRPMPAMNRSAVSIVIVSTEAMASVMTPNVITLHSRVVRRPMRSPSTPPSTPPSIIPKGPAESAWLKAPRGSFHSSINLGRAFGSSWLSTPSRMIVRAVPKMSSF